MNPIFIASPPLPPVVAAPPPPVVAAPPPDVVPALLPESSPHAVTPNRRLAQSAKPAHGVMPIFRLMMLPCVLVAGWWV